MLEDTLGATRQEDYVWHILVYFILLGLDVYLEGVVYSVLVGHERGDIVDY